jgi:hypothetical protein
MANENAGSVYVEIRMKLDSFQADVNKVANAIRGIEDQAKKTSNQTTGSFFKTAKEVVKAITELSSSSVNQFTKMATGISKVFKALPIINAIILITEAIAKLVGGISDYLNKTADAYFRQQKELTTLNAIVQATGASAWTSSAQLNSMAAALSKATGYSSNDITKMQGTILTYTNIVGDNFKRTSKAAIDMAAVMGMDLSSAAETLGKALDSPAEGLTALTRQGFKFKDDLKEQITLLVEHGDISKAQALILNEVESVYQGVGSAQNNAVNKSERLKQVQEELNAEVGRSTSGFTNFVAGIKLSWKESQLFEMRQRRIGEAVKESEGKIQGYKNNIADLKSTLDELIAGGANEERIIKIKVQIENAENALNGLIGDAAVAQEQVEHYTNEWRDLLPLMKEINSLNDRLAGDLRIVAAVEKQIAETTEDYLKRNLEMRIYQNRINITSLNEQIQQKRTIIEQAENEMGLANQRLRINERLQQVEVERIAYNNKVLADTAKITSLEEALTAATEKRKAAVDAAETAKSHDRITEKEMHQQILAAYIEEANQINMLRQQIDALEMQTTEGEASKAAAIVKTNTSLSEAIALERQRRTILADIEMNNVYKDLQDELEKLETAEKDLFELERKRAWEAIENSDDYKNATEDLRLKIRGVFNEITEVNKAKNEPTEEEKQKEYWDNLKDKVNQYGSAINNVISNFAGLHSAFVKKSVDEEIKALDKLYNVQLEYLEKEKQAKLYAKGFIEAQTEEQHQRELELAIESGDQQRIYEAHSNHEKFLIEEEFAKEKEALDQETAKNKAELEYKAAMADWNQQLVNAIISVASGIASVIPIVPLMAFAAAAGAAQIGIISANKPKLQFDSGGIVPGNSFRGDNVLARVNSDEMILNKRQQKNMFNAIDKNEIGGGEQTITIIVPVNLDGKEIARNSVTHINNRSAGFLKQGSIVK